MISGDATKALSGYLDISAKTLETQQGDAAPCITEIKAIAVSLNANLALLQPSDGTVTIQDLLNSISGLRDAVTGTASTAALDKEKRKAAVSSADAEVSSAKKMLSEATTEESKQAAQALLTKAEEAKKVAEAAKKSHDVIVAEASLAAQGLKEIQKKLVSLSARDARYGFYTGAAYSLTRDGGWKPGLNVLYRSEGAIAENLPDWRGHLMFEYFTRSGKKASTEPETPAPTTSPTAAEPKADDPDFVSPFDAKGGIVNLQTGLSWVPVEWAGGLAVRVGLESIPTEDDDSPLNTIKPYYAVGVVTRHIYKQDGSLGQFFLGLGRDLRWRAEYTGEEHNQYTRVMLSGLLEMVKFQNGASIAARISGSAPTSGKDSSTELRLGVVLGFDIDKIRGLAVAP